MKRLSTKHPKKREEIRKFAKFGSEYPRIFNIIEPKTRIFYYFTEKSLNKAAKKRLFYNPANLHRRPLKNEQIYAKMARKITL